MNEPETSGVLHGPWPFHECPRCGLADFLAEDHLGTLFFTCLGCASTWRYSLGYLVAVGADERPSVSD